MMKKKKQSTIKIAKKPMEGKMLMMKEKQMMMKKMKGKK
jgi:hypothetical protein